MATKQAVSSKALGTQIKRQPKFDHNLFETGVIGALKTESRGISDNTDTATQMAAANEAIELFTTSRDERPLEEFGSAVSALQAFAEWLSESNYSYTPPVYYRANGFTVQIVLPNGSSNSSSVFQLHCEVSELGDVEKAFKAAYADLSDIVSANWKPTKSEQKQQTTNQRETDIDVEFNAIRVERFNGKTVYRLIPSEGRWQQHGVALYSDEARKAGIDLSEYEDEGDYDLSGTGDIEYKPDGKPMRWKGINLQ